MKKIASILLLLVLVCACPLAHASPEDFEGRVLPDFNVTTLEGETFPLSEALKTHDLALINLWATWCGPCRVEFPYLQQAWEEYSDRVYVIALSVERTDTLSVLRRFAQSYDLGFPMGRDESNLFGYLQGYAIPTTLLVDRDLRVLRVEIGSQPSKEAFTDLFDSLLPAAPAEQEAPRAAMARPAAR